MDGAAERHFEQILKLAQEFFTEVEIIERDISASRALLHFTAKHQDREISLTEILLSEERRYSYYLLRENHVLIGMDNARDRAALRLKYGKDFSGHIQERLPHLHSDSKRTIALTPKRPSTIL